MGLLSASWLLLNYVTVVVLGSLRTAMLAELAIACFCVIGIAIRYGREAFASLRLGWSATLCFLLVLGLLGAAILLEPLAAWDARSIWFFHAKMVYFAGGLIKDGGWTAPCCIFSHPDYPTLVPILAAQAANLAGFWNEQLPKVALLSLLVPALAVTVSYWRSGLATAALLLIVWAKLAPMLTNGYMDGALALYGLFSVLLIGSWLATGAKVDLATAVLFAGVALGLKNEGSMFAATLLVCMTPTAVLAWRRGRLLLPADGLERLGLAALCCFAITSGVSWLILRGTWGLQLHLGLSSLPSIVRRLMDPEALEMILRSTLVSSGLLYAMLIGVCATGLSCVLRTGRLVEPIFCMGVATVYLAGIQLVYLATPADLKWHLATSADRITLLPALLFVAPAILLLRDERCWRLAIARPGAVRLTCRDQKEPEAGCAITRPRRHSAIRSSPRLGRSAASIARRDGVVG
jgi:hypothetical protein